MKTRSGGVVKPSRVSALVTDAIANVVKRLKAERLKAKKAADAERASERLKHLQKRDVVQLAALRRKDAEVVEKLLDMGQCAVRFKLHGACQMVRRDRVDRAKWLKRRESMKRTSWVLCKACDDEGRHAWHNPFQFYAPNELDTGHRHVPCCAHNDKRPGRKGKPFAFQDLEPLLLPLADHLPGPPDANLYHKLARKESRLMIPRLGYGSTLGTRDVFAPPPPEPVVPDEPPPPPPTFPKCQRKLCQKPPTPDHVLTSANSVGKVSERDYNLETPLRRALRQKVHGHKSVLGMNDVIFYKHMRDHNLEPEEAHAEVLKRKRLIHAGRGSSYEPPEMGHLVLGLLNGVPVDNPTPPPPSPPDLWRTYLKQRAVDNSGIVERLRAF